MNDVAWQVIDQRSDYHLWGCGKCRFLKQKNKAAIISKRLKNLVISKLRTLALQQKLTMYYMLTNQT